MKTFVEATVGLLAKYSLNAFLAGKGNGTDRCFDPLP